ncbi:putative membrane protein [Flavobacterium daejeonense]|nr:putative membrane protein [Flavobacterium daejeonense]
MEINFNKNWHQRHYESLELGSRIADWVAKGMGSWRFIIIQTVFVIVWMGLNLIGYIKHWDAYPFILLNLLFSTQAAYAAPIIMMAQNRQNERDRIQAQDDYATNKEAKLEIEALAAKLNAIEIEKLDKILKILENMQ